MIKAYLTLSLFIYVSLSSYLRSAPFRGYLICDDLGLFISLPPEFLSFYFPLSHRRRNDKEIVIIYFQRVFFSHDCCTLIGKAMTMKNDAQIDISGNMIHNRFSTCTINTFQFLQLVNISWSSSLLYDHRILLPLSASSSPPLFPSDLRLLKYSFLIKNSFRTYSVPLFHKNDRNTHTLPPSLPKSFPFSSVRLHEIIKNNLNETPTRQFLSIALRSAPLNLDRFHGAEYIKIPN